MEKKYLKKLQETQIEILDEIVRICDKHKINYYLAAGTLLGAVRHKGFIPWDDDIDIFIMRDDYDKFINYAINELDDNYFLQSHETESNYYSSFVRVRKNNTLMINKNSINRKGHNGIWVDILPLDYADKDSFSLKLNCFLFKLLKSTIYIKTNYSVDIHHRYLALLFYPLSVNQLWKLSNKILMLKNKKEHKYVGNFVGVYRYNKEMIEMDKVLPYKMVDFEGRKYKAFNDIDYYLKKLYGNYMELPPVEKRVGHDLVEISFDKGDVKHNIKK